MAHLSPLLKQATPVLVERGEGVHLYDEAGRRYLDFTAGIGVTSTGHCHPRVVAAAQEQVAKLIHGQYTTVMHRPLLTLAERLGEVLPDDLDSVFFSNSGSEAVEAALRLARHATAPAQHRGVPRLLPRTHHRGRVHDDLGDQVPRRLLPAHGRGRGVAVPDGVPVRLGRGHGHRVRAARARLRAGHGERARGDRRLPGRAGPRRGRLRAGEHGVHGGPAGARRPARHPAGPRRGADRLGPDGTVLGTRPLRRATGHPDHRQGAGQRVPAVRHRRVHRADGEGLAGIAGRHVRRQRGRLRRGDRDPRRDPGGEPRRERPRRRRRPRGRPGEGRRRQPADRRRPGSRPDARHRVRHPGRPARSRRRASVPSRSPASAGCCC